MWADKLIEMRACSYAVAWASGYASALEAWEACERPDWLLWVAAKQASSREDYQAIVLAAAACARTALEYVPAGEERPLKAILAAERWARNPSQENERAAAEAAEAAGAAAGAAAREAGDTGEMANLVRGFITLK